MEMEVSKELLEELDEMAMRMLRLMNEYIKVQLSLQEFIKTGCLNLAKSRYIMGNTSVSALQLPSEDSSEFSASTRVIAHGGEDTGDLSFELSKVSLGDINIETDVKSRLPNKDHKEDTPVGNKTKIIVPDPLRWFGVLVPQNLRTAQNQFSIAIEYSIQLANIQTELEGLKKSSAIKILKKGGPKK